LSNRHREHRAEPLGGWRHSIVFQSMDGCAHAAIVRSKGNCAHKRWRREAACAAELRRRQDLDGRLVKAVAATQANGSGVERNFSPARVTNWNGRELWQRGAAQSAGSGKEAGTDCVQRTSENPRNGAPTGCLRK
jgi:hypothetical protein